MSPPDLHTRRRILALLAGGVVLGASPFGFGGKGSSSLAPSAAWAGNDDDNSGSGSGDDDDDGGRGRGRGGNEDDQDDNSGPGLSLILFGSKSSEFRGRGACRRGWGRYSGLFFGRADAGERRPQSLAGL